MWGIGGEATDLHGLNQEGECVLTNVFYVCIHNAHCKCSSWSERISDFKEEAPGWTPASWACVLFLHLLFPPCLSALKLPEFQSLQDSKNKHCIYLSYVCVGLFAWQHSSWTQAEKDETQQEMLSVWHHTLLFTPRSLLSNGLSHPVIPPPHTPHKMCHCTNLRFFPSQAIARDIYSR